MSVPKITLKGDDVKRIRGLLKIYGIVVFEESLTDRETEVLAEYFIYGYGKKAKSAIKLNYQISYNNIKQVDRRLQEKGILIPIIDKQHKQTKKLHADLELARQLFVENSSQYLILQVNNVIQS